jgi:hypothetical protein
MNYLQKTDPYSGEKFTPKRYNQRFSSRKNQIAFNNFLALKKRHEKAPFDRVLESNRKILSSILSKLTSRIVSREFLLGAGFNFNFFNGSYQVDGTNYQTIYNFAITRVDGGKFKIIKRSRDGK